MLGGGTADVGQATFVNFPADIGLVSPHSYKEGPLTGFNAQGDHLLLTPSYADSLGSALDYSVEYLSNQQGAKLVACNHTNFTVNDETTHFNLLIFDAQ